MIFVTIGTSEPFDRLLRSVDELEAGEEIIVQCGDSEHRPGRATCIGYLDHDELERRVCESRVVVMHAGVGSVFTAFRNGKVPVIVPRLARFGEAVDDHQLAFARLLGAQGSAVVIEDLSRLPEGIEEAAVAGPPPAGKSLLARELAIVVRGLLRSPGSPSRP